MPRLIRFAIPILILLVSCAPFLVLNAALQEVDIVVDRANNTGLLSREEVRRIFMGDKTSWPGGKRITVLMFTPDQPERGIVLREVFKMNESDYTKYFLQAAFTGRVQAAPRELPSAPQMKARLLANPNAIGYLKKEDLDDSVKVVLRLP